MTTATLNDTVRIPERITFRRVRDEMALLNLETGVYFGLDEIGARMWELLAEHRNLQVVAERMAEEYDVAPAQLREDLLRLTRELIAKGLIEVG
jgi:hypothetical protein